MHWWNHIHEDLKRGGLVYRCAEAGHEIHQSKEAIAAYIAGTGENIPEKCPGCEGKGIEEALAQVQG